MSDIGIRPEAVQIRSTHRYGFRSGEWALLVGIFWDKVKERPCYVVLFPDGTPDSWPVQDRSDAYEFRAATTDQAQ